MRILKIKRRSKYLLFFLNKNLVILVHLGMTGKFLIIKKDNEIQKTSFYYEVENNDKKHDRVIFSLNIGSKIIYNDVRKFGFIKIVKEKDLNQNQHLNIIGPEPLSDIFNLNYFKNYIVNRTRLIKDLLMDQKFVSGLGNIYVNEILFLSKVKPNKKTKNLKNKELVKIIKNTKKVLKKAILFGGSSIKNFSSSYGKKGNFQQHFAVYGKKGSKCSNNDCKEIIKKIMISNRASFFCSKCQK